MWPRGTGGHAYSPILCLVDSLKLAHWENLYHRKKHYQSGLYSQELSWCALCKKNKYDDCLLQEDSNLFPDGRRSFVEWSPNGLSQHLHSIHLADPGGQLLLTIQVHIPTKSKCINLMLLEAWWFWQLLQVEAFITEDRTWQSPGDLVQHYTWKDKELWEPQVHILPVTCCLILGKALASPNSIFKVQ